MSYLDKTNPLDVEIKVEIVDINELTDSDLVEKYIDNLDVPVVYGAFDQKLGRIVIAADDFYPKYSSLILLLLAHEYYHAIQFYKRQQYDERMADVFAVKEVLHFVANRGKV